MTTLLKAISDSDTTLMFSETANFPQDDGVIQIESEIIFYKTIYMNTMYGCTRGARSTSAASHAAGSTIVLVDFFDTAGSGSSGATVALDNLVNTAINADLSLTDNLLINLNTAKTSYIWYDVLNGTLEINSAGNVVSLLHQNGSEVARFDKSVVADDTRFLLWDVTAGALVRVSRGAADSGGTGFRLLRIPN